MPLMLTSPAIPPGGPIPQQYTCEGPDISPPLAFSGVPDGTRSLVLLIEDPDAPSGIFRHWAVFDIPARARGLEAGYSAARPAAGFREARNDFGRPGYAGPCPPKAHGAHHYHIRLLAVSRPSLNLGTAATALDVLKAAQPYVLERTELVGTYQR